MSPVDRGWWKPLPLTVSFMAIAVMDAVILWIASGTVTSDNDAAGNGMVNAFRNGFVETGSWFAAFVVLLFVVIRRRSIRVALIVMLIPTTLCSLLLL